MTAARLFNVYCDESCHLEHDGIPVMANAITIGALSVGIMPPSGCGR